LVVMSYVVKTSMFIVRWYKDVGGLKSSDKSKKRVEMSCAVVTVEGSRAKRPRGTYHVSLTYLVCGRERIQQRFRLEIYSEA
jgi:hypothetical protein